MRRLFPAAVLLLACCAAPSSRSLFDGRALAPWEPAPFGGEGKIEVVDGAIRASAGNPLTGVRWAGGALPRTNYEFSVEAMKLDGNDFFCGIVFPVGPDLCSFVAGGWGGGVTGLSSVDEMYASDNETYSHRVYAPNRWYSFRIRVTPEKIEAWVDRDQVVNLELVKKLESHTPSGVVFLKEPRKISVHPSLEIAAPLAVCCYDTAALYRNFTFRELR